MLESGLHVNDIARALRVHVRQVDAWLAQETLPRMTENGKDAIDKPRFLR